MIEGAAARARGRGRASWSRKQVEALAGGKGETDDADPAQLCRVIRVRGVVPSVI
jgi:hypothetical protein